MARPAFCHCDGALDIVALPRKALKGHNLVKWNLEVGVTLFVSCAQFSIEHTKIFMRKGDDA